ncbi:MAG TPA: tripartite tricarboxylate transporter TctB family protein [Candidatus Limnocylindria bacterium]|nr:tripartite tricarboxylate transporter TctB family protein [Candidatus Limnocylindria bacterium]
MRTAEITTSTILLAISALVIYEAFRLGFGWGLEGPQPGFFIFWLGAGLGVCSVITIVRVWFDGPIRWRRFFPTAAWSEVLRVFVPMAGAILLMELLGFYIAAAIYLAFFMRWVGDFSWKMVLLVALLFAVSHYFVFEKWFLVPLPKGLLEAYIGI